MTLMGIGELNVLNRVGGVTVPLERILSRKVAACAPLSRTDLTHP